MEHAEETYKARSLSSKLEFLVGKIMLKNIVTAYDSTKSQTAKQVNSNMARRF